MSGQATPTRADNAEVRAAKAHEQTEDSTAAIEPPAPSATPGLTSGLLQAGAPVNGSARGGGLNPTISRQLLRLQASHGNHYVRSLVDRSTTARPGPNQAAPAVQLKEQEESPAAEAGAEGKGGLALPTPPPSGPSAPPAEGAGPPAGGAASPSGNGGDGLPPDPTAGRGRFQGVPNSSLLASTSGEAPADETVEPEDRGPAARVQRSVSLPPSEAREEHKSDGGASDGGAGGPGAGPQAPSGAADAIKEGAQPGAGEPGSEHGGGAGEAEKAAEDATRKINAANMDEQMAALVADFLSQFESRLGEVDGPVAGLLNPGVRQAAARMLPDRKDELVGKEIEAPEPEKIEGAKLQRSPAGIQRQAPGTGTIPTRKVKVTLPDWQKIPLFKEKNVGSWFLLSGEIESPTYEGEVQPPAHLRDDKTEQELQMTADGKVKGYSATLYKDTIAKVGKGELEGKVQVEATDKSVKVSGLSLKAPDLGGGSPLLLEGQFDFDLLEWEKGKPPDLMVLSYTQKIGLKRDFTNDGWTVKGQLFLPIKLSIKPNPAKVAEYVARVIGPRLAAAAPAGLAIGAPLVVGAVCIAIWVHAVEAGEDMSKAMDEAKLNTLGYVTSYFNTIMGYTHQRYSNAGSAQGKAAAQKVLDQLRFDELPAGAQQKIRDEYIKAGTLNMPAIQESMWKQYRAAAIDSYRKEHEWDAWAYDKGLPSSLSSLIKYMDIVGPPWPVSAY